MDVNKINFVLICNVIFKFISDVFEQLKYFSDQQKTARVEEFVVSDILKIFKNIIPYQFDIYT